MDGRELERSTMRFPEQWLAVLRIAIGLWFAKALLTKVGVTLAWGFVPLPTASTRWLHVMPILVEKYITGNPVAFYRSFVLTTVLPHAAGFALLTALGESAVGLGLVLGCLTVPAAAGGLFLVANYFLAVQWQGSAQQGFHYALAVCLIVILATRAGRHWGVDGWIRARHPGSLLARLPLG